MRTGGKLLSPFQKAIKQVGPHLGVCRSPTPPHGSLRQGMITSTSTHLHDVPEASFTPRANSSSDVFASSGQKPGPACNTVARSAQSASRLRFMDSSISAARKMPEDIQDAVAGLLELSGRTEATAAETPRAPPPLFCS